MLERLKTKIHSAIASKMDKGGHEMAYWRSRAQVEGTLDNSHYLALYTDMFGLDRSFYAEKRVLDVGSGPRGSLEWATDAAQRVGLDPLAEKYRELGIDDHGMDYVAVPAERIPFPKGHFDIVTSINSLDHVDDVAAAI